MSGPELRLVQPLDRPGGDLLRSWAQRGSDAPIPTTPPLAGQLRFAFYGRVSTEDHQDPVSSRAWQRTRAEALIAGTGQIVVEFFDVGRSRVLPWDARPAAAALIAALADPDRRFDAIVVGEAERAFYGPQYEQMAPIFAKHGVRVWVPDVGGPVDPKIGSLEELMALFGILSKREIVRARIRTMTSMTILTERQGRFLGGRALGQDAARAGPGPDDGADRGMDVRPAASRNELRPYRAGLERCADPAAVRSRSGTQPAPRGTGVDWHIRRGDPDQPPATPDTKSGSAHAPTTNSSTRPTPRSATGTRSGTTAPTSGSSPRTSPTRHWSAPLTSSPCRVCALGLMQPSMTTCWPAS